MPAHSRSFPWPPYYGHFRFFEERMRAHSHVTELTADDDGVYDLTLTSGETLRVFVCECYSFGVAEYIESTDVLGDLDAIIINSAWCGYTHEAKRFCRDKSVGLFTIGDFMAALNTKQFWLYLDKQEKELFKEKGWL